VQLEHQRGTNHGRGGAWLTGCRVPQIGRTPLHLAAEKGHAAVAGALLAAKADKEAKDEVRGVGEYWGISESGWGVGEHNLDCASLRLARIQDHCAGPRF